MDEDFGFDSGFDDVGSSDIDIDSGFDDSSFDTDFSMDDIGSEDIISDDFSETDFSMDAVENFDSFDDVESTELDVPPAENDFLIETDDELELPDENFEVDETTNIDVDDSSLELDDYDANIDMLDMEDTSSMSELDTDGFDDTFDTDNVTNDTVEDEELITEAEDDGYFEDIPNEIEPFVMQEAQAETGADTVETMSEFEDELSEESESVLGTDTFEETESQEDVISNEPPPAGTDKDTTDEEMVIEETNAPESDKTPYEAMRDYMYEHNYGQMDYPEYSQDPEWQALNEQYTDSLEETPSAAEISVENFDQVLDNPDISESQDLNESNLIDVQEGTYDDTSETSEVIEEPSDAATLETADTDVSEGEKTPYEAMRDYMYEHNYSQMDYPEYSQDPEWQALNEQYTDSLEETPSATEISAENFDQVLDTPDISEPQDLNEGDLIDVQEETYDDTSETSEVIEEPSDVATLETADTDVSEDEKTPYEAMRDYMYEHNYGQMDYSEYSQDPEWQALNEQYTDFLEETPSVAEISAENFDQVLDTPDISETQEFVNGEIVDNQSDEDVLFNDISEPIVNDALGDISAEQTELEFTYASPDIPSKIAEYDTTDMPTGVPGDIENNDLQPSETSDVNDKVDISNWIKEINPNYDPFDLDAAYDNNCGSCAFAVNKRLDGDTEIVASVENIGTIEEMNAATGMEQVSMTPKEIEQTLLAQGSGAHAIIGIDRADGPGHWFNAANIDGKIVTIDGQDGSISDWPPDYGDVTNWDMSVKKEKG